MRKAIKQEMAYTDLDEWLINNKSQRIQQMKSGGTTMAGLIEGRSSWKEKFVN